MTKDQIYELLKTEAAKRCDAHWLGAGSKPTESADLAKANAQIAELETQCNANEDTIREQYGQTVAYREAIDDLEKQLAAMQQRAELAEATRKEATTPALKALVEWAEKQNKEKP